MKRIFFSFVVVAAIAISAVFQFGCSKKAVSNNDTVYVYQFGYNVPVAIVSKEELPEFLRNRIDGLLEIYVEYPTSCSVEIFRGEWSKRTVYYVYPWGSSCAFCEVYWSDGTIIDWSNRDDFEDFYTIKRNWVLIYQIKGGIVTQ